MPLYIKIIEFIDRDYQYGKLVKAICQGLDYDKEKVMAIFEWTHKNIKSNIPKDWPIVDDHVWNIILRGYGTDDQFSDVFTTLCTYAGVPSFRGWISPKENSQARIAISFVKLDNRWVIFDPYYKIYFININCELASVANIIQNPSITKIAQNKPDRHGIEYVKYFNNLKHVKKANISRAKQHKPISRLLNIIRNIVSKQKRHKESIE